MMASRLTVTGVVCLLGASVGSLVQFVVSPIGAGDPASAQVAAAAAHPTRMAWAAVLDLPILLLIPALVYIAWLAGARSSRLAAIGAGLTFATALALSATCWRLTRCCTRRASSRSAARRSTWSRVIWAPAWSPEW
jgi:hypothetical protein